MRYRFTTVITKEDPWYVVRALELGVVSQGKSIEEAEKNLREAVELYLEDAEPPRLQFAPLVTSLEVEYA